MRSVVLVDDDVSSASCSRAVLDRRLRRAVGDLGSTALEMVNRDYESIVTDRKCGHYGIELCERIVANGPTCR